MALINTARSTHLWRHLQVSGGCSSYLLHVYPSLWPQRWFVLMLLLLKTPSLTAEPVFPSFHHGTGTSGSSGVFLAPARLELLRYPTLWTELWIIPLHSSPSELRCLFWGSSDCWGSASRTKDQVLRGSEVTWLSLFEAPLRDSEGMQSASWFCSSEQKLTEAGGFRVVICKTFLVKTNYRCLVLFIQKLLCFAQLFSGVYCVVIIVSHTSDILENKTEKFKTQELKLFVCT